MKTCLLAVITVAAFSVNAEQIEVPHTFNDGAPAYADEVNENFEAIATNSNSNDTRLTNIETPKQNTQMFCWHLPNSGYGVGTFRKFIEGNNDLYPEHNLLNCYIPKESNNKYQLSSSDIFSEGWKLISRDFGGTNEYLFEK